MAGGSLSTHLVNGSHGMIPRLNNYICEPLASDDLTTGLISDSFHVPESVVQVFLRVKGRNRLILVSGVAVLGGSNPEIKETIKLCTENPIRLLGLSSTLSPELKEGSPANLVQFRYNKHDKRLSVEKTILKGEEIFSSHS